VFGNLIKFYRVLVSGTSYPVACRFSGILACIGQPLVKVICFLKLYLAVRVKWFIVLPSKKTSISANLMPLHHYLPASFIARFSADAHKQPSRERRVTVGDKKEQRWFEAPADKVGCINNLYALANRAILPIEIDQTWKEYERRLPIAVDSLIQKNVDAETWFRVLVPFVACMLVRGPDFEERFNQRFPPALRQKFSEIFNPDNANRARLRELQRLLTCVVASKWLVLTTHGKEQLITNDLGYAPFLNPMFGHRGLAIPLAQRTILAIIPAIEDRIILREQDDKWIPVIEYVDLPPGNHEGLNRALAGVALRFIFGPNAQLVQKYFRGISQSFTAPEPTELGFPIELLSPSFEFTWHRLVGAIKKPPSEMEGWDFPLDWNAVADGWHSMAFTPENLVEFPPALQRINNTIQLKFYDPKVYYDISAILLLKETGNHDAAINEATKTLADPLSPSLRARVLILRGGSLDDVGKINEALADFEEACKLDPSSAQAHVDYGYALLSVDNPVKAAEVLTKAIALNPKLGPAYMDRSAAFWKLDRLTEALEDANAAIDLLSVDLARAKAFVNRGLVLLDLKQYQKAAEDFALAASLYTDSPTKAKCLIRQGFAFLSLSLFDQAFDSYNKAVELNPTDHEALVGRALLYLKQGNINKAVTDHKSAVFHAPDLVIKSQLLNMKEFRFSVWSRLRKFFNRIIGQIFRSMV